MSFGCVQHIVQGEFNMNSLPFLVVDVGVRGEDGRRDLANLLFYIFCKVQLL